MTRICTPTGILNPEIYFIADSPSVEEKLSGMPMSGKVGMNFRSMLSSLGLNDNNCRFGYLYCDIDDPEDMSHTINDIKNSNPKVIMILGSKSLKGLFPSISNIITKLHGTTLDYNGIIAIPAYHPAYIENRDNDVNLRMELKADIKLAIKCALDPDNSRAKATSESGNNVTVLCKTYEEFDNFCKEHIDGEKTVGFDVETNAEYIYSSKHKVIGFSLSSSLELGCYVPLESLDYKVSEEDKALIEKRLSDILVDESIQVLVYNCQHEYPATLNWLGIEITNLDDIFVMVKLMMGNADRYIGNGGLKAQSVIHLNYSDWSDDLDEYFTYLKDYDKSTNKEKMYDLINKYYKEETPSVIDLIDNYYKNNLEGAKLNYVLSYGLIPYKVVGEYGSTDSSILFELYNFYVEWMKKEGNTLGIDLFKGYKYWMMHHYAGFILEKNGAYWNENKANEIETWCKNGMLYSIKELIHSDLSSIYIKNKLYNEYLVYMKDNYLEDLLGKGYTPKRLFKNSVDVMCNNQESIDILHRMSIRSKKNKQGKDTGVYKLQLGNIETIGLKYLMEHTALYDEWYKEYMDKYLAEEHTVDEYKKLFNPNATNVLYREFVSNILITPEIRYARLYSSLVGLVGTPDFNIDKYEGDNKSLLSLIHKLEHNDSMEKSNRFDIFMKFMNKDRNFGYVVKSKISQSLNWRLSSLDANSINEISEYYAMLHIDVEDKSTWNIQFKWLFDYKMYKKYSKLLSTYIYGKVGRQNVYLVNKESLENGDELTRREYHYNKDFNDYNIEGRDYLLQNYFRVNMAETGRWQCFTGNTDILLNKNSNVINFVDYPENSNMSISFEEIVNKDIQYLPVYSFNDKNELVNTLASDIKITDYTDHLVEIYLSDGSVIECTPDHRFRLKDSSYKEAMFLTEDDELAQVDLPEDLHTFKA